MWCTVGALAASPQDKKVTLTFKNVSIETVLNEIKRQTGVNLLYNSQMFSGSRPVSVDVKNEPLESALKQMLSPQGFEFVYENGILVIKKQKQSHRIHGTVCNDSGEPVPGASILIKGTRQGTSTDFNGAFALDLPSGAATLEVSFIGMKKVTVHADTSKSQSIDVTLYDDTNSIDEVVVTGIYTRKAESFTGSATTVSGKDLLRVGNSNVFQSLKNLDPTVYIPDNLTMGSDPNTTPTISMRGTSSLPTTESSSLKSNYQNQPNQPLFILDGFETSVESVMDMDMNRIESITILKDASAKALYGSKAANGVIVIETKRLGGNKQRITYNGSLSLEIPDLTSYDLCNAMEKLEVERLDGVYKDINLDKQIAADQLYNTRLQKVLQGQNTDWLSKPIHTGIGHKHNINIEVGDSQSLRAVLDFTYNNINGAMKGSDRENISGNANISYRYKKIIFRDIFSIVSNHSSDSPYGSFSDYAKMNPYWQAVDENGNVVRWAEYNNNLKVANPLYDATIGTEFSSSYLEFSNNLYAEWMFHPEWKATVRLGVSQKRNDSEDFYPAQHSMFAKYTSKDEMTRRGRYIIENGKHSSLSGDFNINYNKEINKHTIFANAGFFLSEEKYSAYQHTAEGFSNTSKADITFAKQYLQESTPVGSSSINREASFLFAASYDYNNRYLADATVRESASSLYGADNRWANSWSFGLGWNLHNEKFMKPLTWLKQFKLRASVGLTGNQNFNTSAAIATYHYFSGVTYGGSTNPMMGAYLYNMPNSALKWEQKKDYNIGFDMRIAGLTLKFDYYSADTKNMLTDVAIPTSTGFSSIKDNLGLVRNSGVELSANYTIWQGRRGFVNIYGTYTYNKNKIVRLSDSMRSYNEKMMSLAESTNQSTPVLLYQDGMSMNTIWAVPSAGIDPQTGQEIYIKKDGSYTYTYSSSDLVAAGDATPKYRGTAGFTAEYAGIGLSVTLSYLGGCQMYNTTLVDRVENVDINYNVDRRLLEGRWTTPGQVTQYKKFQSDETTRATTRFVQDRRELSISSISAYYEFPRSVYAKLLMQRLRVAFNLNNIATFSSIKVERGLDYPFARTMSFSLTATF